MNSYRLLSTKVSIRLEIVFRACLPFRRWAKMKLHFLPLNCRHLVGPTLEKQMKPCVNKDPRTRLIPHVLCCNNCSPVNVAERLQTKRGYNTHPSSQLIILQSFCSVWRSHSLKEDQHFLIFLKWQALFCVSDRQALVRTYCKTIKNPPGCLAHINVISWHQLHQKQLVCFKLHKLFSLWVTKSVSSPHVRRHSAQLRLSQGSSVTPKLSGTHQQVTLHQWGEISP